jgi:predicted lipid-binding transport protein (Tim44 family)
MLWLIFAAAGGGSAGFGGGGGGGFGGGFGGGGAGTYGSGWFEVAFWVVVVLFVVLVQVVVPARYRRQRQARERQVELAAAEAADDDPAFAPDAVVTAAEALFGAAQEAWDARDDARLQELLSPDLLVEWRRRLADFAAKEWHNRVEVRSVSAIEYLGLVNREGEADDHVTVRIEALLRDYVELPTGRHMPRKGEKSENVTLAEYWTLGRRDGRWIVASIEQDKEGRHALTDPIVATPAGDDERLAGAAVNEVAAGEKLPDGVATSEVADLDYSGDARAAALDLSLADGRWAPAVLEAAARRAVAAWAEAVDGADRDLLDVATPQAAAALLHPGDPSAKTRLVVRGPRVRRVRIAALDAAAQPPAMTIEVEVSGRRYVEDRDTAAVLSGSRERATTFTERWTLALSGPDDRPWQVVDAAGGAVPA